MSEAKLLIAKDITKSFKTPDGSLSILRGLSLELDGSEALSVTGPSGCGKSTLLSILGGLDTATSGTIAFDGEDLTSLDEVARSKFRNETVGFVFQDHHLLPQCTVVENVLIPLLATRKATVEDLERAESLLDRVGLSHRRDHVPGQLSGGERQRTALCRALVNRPRLLLADEPTGNLDPKTADTVGELLLGIGEETNAALICVTHSESLANRFPKRLRLVDGQIENLEMASDRVVAPR